MSDFQYKAYIDVLKNQENTHGNYKKISSSKAIAMKSLSVKNLPNHFFIGTRFISLFKGFSFIYKNIIDVI